MNGSLLGAVAAEAAAAEEASEDAGAKPGLLALDARPAACDVKGDALSLWADR